MKEATPPEDPNTPEESSDSEEIDFGNEVDLHHFNPRHTDLVVREFLRQALEKGLSPVRIIHGKGKSVKKHRVYQLLDENPDVLGYRDDRHNWGATLVELKVKE
ncbi:MAG: Smr/MutS family protein [bacterium]|nr:Smr/MutS family protein [bacterium]